MYNVSPREAWLEVQYANLKSKVEYLERMQGTTYSFNSDPKEQTVSYLREILEIATLATAERDNQGLHVYIREISPRLTNPLNIAYYLSNAALEKISPAERASMAAKMHGDLVTSIGNHFWSKA